MRDPNNNNYNNNNYNNSYNNNNYKNSSEKTQQNGHQNTYQNGYQNGSYTQAPRNNGNSYNGNYRRDYQNNGYAGGPRQYNTPYQTGASNANTGLIVTLCILIVVVLIMGIVFASLYFCGIISFGNNDKNIDTYIAQEADLPSGDNSAAQSDVQSDVQSDAVADRVPIATSAPTGKPSNSDTQSVVVPVGQTMYIGNCNTSVTLRVGPATSYDGICQVPLAAAIYVIEYTNDDFAKITYNGNTGFIMRSYIVSTKPDIEDFDSAAVCRFVENSFRAFVNGINTGDTSYIYDYYSGDIANSELSAHNEIYEIVQSEEILQLSCHSATRASSNTVTVIRDSVTRVVYRDGSVKDITEKYKATVKLNNGSMSIIALDDM